ncbi:SPOR domain-containing protein [Shewanella sedimentimangrovi]|uniref:SPOR domain-containing protein n=1 Tax=Shewanella sedimentimangrovi TaxID=2814293 RepID=A0ABX7R304_9GAMM|nr:SPOR domain-containing protein [Shewanella sedimentimangrovi]QSX37672.1 SPOR domain-containing protein [Shewanella sedimentimangrovi]
MSRDYANRKPRGPASRGSRKKAAPPARKPWLLIAIVMAAVAAFGYFLWSIKGSAEAPQAKQTAPKTQAASPAKKDPNALPPKPKEEWTYLEELENKQVEVDVPDDAMKSAGPYQMQCGSFRKQEQAEEMKAVIAFQGLEAQVRRVEGSSGVWFKVVLGPFERRRDGEKAKHKLQNAGMNGCRIWLWQN